MGKINCSSISTSIFFKPTSVIVIQDEFCCDDLFRLEVMHCFVVFMFHNTQVRNYQENKETGGEFDITISGDIDVVTLSLYTCGMYLHTICKRQSIIPIIVLRNF